MNSMFASTAQHHRRMRTNINSRVVGTVNWESVKLRMANEVINSMPANSAYSEYASGNWASIMLANWSGDFRDGNSKEYDGSARHTEHGRQVPYLMNMLESIFRMDLAKSVRIFLCGSGGQIVTHRDYTEFATGFTRLHLPLQTGDGCMNSEGGSVYRMKVGQIVYLDGYHPHSAVAHIDGNRLHLVVDFDPAVPFADLFRDPSCYREDVELDFVERPEMPEKRREQLRSLGHILSEANFREVHGLLNHEHFVFDITAQETYVMLIEAARLSGDETLVRKAQVATRYFLGRDDPFEA